MAHKQQQHQENHEMEVDSITSGQDVVMGSVSGTDAIPSTQNSSVSSIAATKAINYDTILESLRDAMNKQLAKGQTWYLLDKKWYEMCTKFLQEKDPSLNPGPIDNEPLFNPTTTANNNGPRELKERLQDELDYVLISEEGWDLLVDIFGITNEHHTIKRQVIEQGHFSSYCVVEVYPIELKLCKYGSKEVVVKQFSRATTLAELESEMKKLFNVPDNKDTQLWAAGNVLNPHADASSSSGAASASTSQSKANDSQSLNDAGLHTGAVVTLEIKNPDDTWPSSKPKYGSIATRSSKCVPGLCGLMNLGNTCFMNSALQCLSNTVPLTQYMLSDKYKEELNVDNPLGMHGEIARTYAELIKALWSGNHTCLAPREFKVAVGKFAPQFSGFSQQDCQELMAFLLDGLHEDLNRIKQKPFIEIKTGVDNRTDGRIATEAWRNYKKRNDSIIVDIFHGQLKSTVICPDCQLLSRTFDPFCYLSLPLPVKRERAIDLTFIPAHTKPFAKDSDSEVKQISISKLPIPKAGRISEIAEAVARVVNENQILAHEVKPDSLVVTEIYNHRFHKLFSNDDTYSGQIDDIVVYEVGDDAMPIPVYLREQKGEENVQVFGRPLIISVNEATYDAIYNAVVDQLKRCMKPLPEDEDESDTDEGVAECDGVHDTFTLSVVNSHGSIEFEKLDRNKEIKSLTKKCYLAADFPSKMRKLYDEDSDGIHRIGNPQKAANTGRQSVSLNDCISSFTLTEKLGKDDVWYCPRCKEHKQATKKFDIWSLPDVLIIHLKRFSYLRFWRDKLDTLVEFPLEGLNMADYVMNKSPSDDPDSYTYDLIAVANHYGGLGGGHYTAYAKNDQTQKWHYFDDSSVTQASEENVVSKAAYVLFYKRRGAAPPSVDMAAQL